MHGPRPVSEQAVADLGWTRHVWIVEDEPAAGMLAAELCEACGAEASVFRAPVPYLAALRGVGAPMAVVLDWRLENQLSAALFLATRNRHPRMPVIYWTASPGSSLPAMIRDDRWTMVVDKAGGAESFESALSWALAAEGESQPA